LFTSNLCALASLREIVYFFTASCAVGYGLAPPRGLAGGTQFGPTESSSRDSRSRTQGLAVIFAIRRVCQWAPPRCIGALRLLFPIGRDVPGHFVRVWSSSL